MGVSTPAALSALTTESPSIPGIIRSITMASKAEELAR